MYIIFLFVYPDHISIRAAHKQDVMDVVARQDEDGLFPHNQHGGKKVDSGTYFLDTTEEDMPFLIDLDKVKWVR